MEETWIPPKEKRMDAKVDAEVLSVTKLEKQRALP